MGSFGISLVIFLLYAEVFQVGDYAVTVGSLCVPIFIITTIIANYRRMRYLLYLGSMAAYPVLVYGAHLAFGSGYAIEPQRFLLSYTLWLTSIVTIWCGFQPRTILRDMRPSKVLWALLALGGLQYFGTRFLGTTVGYSLVQPFSITDFFSGYTNVLASDEIRAVGSYYEPSMFGRVASTLAIMLLVRDKKFYRFLGYTAIAYVLSNSFSIVFLAVVAMVIYSAGLKKSFIWLAITGLITLLLGSTVLEKRLEVGVGGETNNSTLVRTVVPLYVLQGLLPRYPMGVPIGANSLVVDKTATAELLDFHEAKITNGIYEFIMYFGFASLVPFSFGGLFIANRLRRKDIPMALAGIYLVLATGASSSFLSIESSLLIAMFTISMRYQSTSAEWRISKSSSLLRKQIPWMPARLDVSYVNER